MKNSFAPTDQRGILATQITALDSPINQLTDFLNAKEIKAGSLMLSGTAGNLRDLHRLLAWNASVLPIPVDLVREFLFKYKEQLIAERWALIAQLEALVEKKEDQV